MVKGIALGADRVFIKIGDCIRGREGTNFEDEVFATHSNGGDAPPDEEDLDCDTAETRDLTIGDVSGDGGLVFDGVHIGYVDSAGRFEVERESAIALVKLVARHRGWQQACRKPILLQDLVCRGAVAVSHIQMLGMA
ncbi:hypothetical protein GOP47_0019260 [Adiantum capillus-veneris]|uniref:Uncharacterized protein n=1 Tax=Adiantum capillus-veneris TaxID=13818 RepID=A0A9D4UET7_ADICA|nr:hypothetical protein GOP47_0019260 [Adiantum capillus-veneris]